MSIPARSHLEWAIRHDIDYLIMSTNLTDQDMVIGQMEPDDFKPLDRTFTLRLKSSAVDWTFKAEDVPPWTYDNELIDNLVKIIADQIMGYMET